MRRVGELAASAGLFAPAATADPAPVAIRLAGSDDRSELERLAALDSARVPAGETLVAEVGGRIRAALSLSGGGVVADPFRPTGSLAALLELRARQLRGEGRSHAAARRLLGHALPAAVVPRRHA
ncbi:MAG TPA: hypothetical protein VF520_13655 [Thermoleophilaceae bacterium]